jgi:hypothetical protein
MLTIARPITAGRPCAGLAIAFEKKLAADPAHKPLISLGRTTAV